MGKYLLLWEIDRSRMIVDRKERGAGFTVLMEMVKQDMKKGLTKDWGAFVGELAGYSIVEGNEVEIMTQLQQFEPYVYFKVYPIGTITQVEEMIKSLSK